MFDDSIPLHLSKSLHALCPKLDQKNLQFDGPVDDIVQEGDMDDVDKMDEPLDPDGAGADIIFDGDGSREEEDKGSQEDNMDSDSSGYDEHPRKRIRISADAAIASIGLEDGSLGTGRISHSVSISSSRSSSVENFFPEMSTS